ncbi:MAG: alanine racemase, partial [Oscillospiraceae bacterium]|nr:alanine racemase [Oscillospiraceae bacterium]
FTTRHCCNSAGATLYPEMRLDMVRLGIIMYGYSPNPPDIKEINVAPVMTLKSIISMVKDVPKDTSVSYGRTYKSSSDMKIATVPIGYADGYMRALSNCGRVIVSGQYANIIGRVCMDQMMIDVTHIKDVKMGDEVTLFGKDGNLQISADDIAKEVGTISYEILCVLGKRVPRIYIENGKEIATLNYINKEV